MPRTAVILLAAGSGRRMAGVVADKVLAPLAGRPVFAHAAGAFAASGVADLYVVVYRDAAQMRRLSAWAPTPALLVPGGAERSESVMNALAALPTDIERVFIHDCARPLIRPEQLTALQKRADRAPALVLAHRVTDTIKELRGRGKLRTLERSRLWAMETPQVFSRRLIARAYGRVAERGLGVTDDAAAVELLGHAIALEENPHPNPKLTTPGDFAYVEFLLARAAAAADISPA
jgi:2-C-methyl-D-erythritol 4-phosphate cytidylyltransferase